ncbi:MAG: membrane fusion protein (multidrug efflux system) [Bacteroidia bacterium]|jgi:membrane fusion protein (multidrug efflux system)
MKSIYIHKTLIFLLVAGCLVACGDSKTAALEKPGAPNQKVQKVEVVVPIQRSFIGEVSITGTAKPNQMVTLFAMESGMLISIQKDIGDRVYQNETIAVLENPALKQQQIKWKAEVQATKNQFDRLNSIYKQTPALTTIHLVETAEAAYLSAKASLDAVSNRIGYLSIKAPFSGIITKRYVDKGAMIQSGLDESNPQAIVDIQDVNRIRLTLPVPESDAVGIKKGMPVQITFPELSSEVYEAKVSRVSNTLDPLSKTMQVEIDLDNRDGKIISGMYAKVLLRLTSRSNILSLPVIAKTSHKNEDYVLVVEDNKVKRLPIKVGLSDRNYFEVLNAEITADTKVIIEGKGLVTPGQIVEPINKRAE